MLGKFDIEKCWETEDGLKALRERKVTVGNNYEKTVAYLTYPTIQFIFEAWLAKGGEPHEVEEDNEYNGSIEFCVYVCLKGNVPVDQPELASFADEDGLMWESYKYAPVDNEDFDDVDLSSDDWMKNLEKKMNDIANLYVEDNNFTFDKPNF